MGDNPSVKQLKADFADLAKNMAVNMHEATLMMADELVSNIKANAPLGETGHLRNSIHKVDLSNVGSQIGADLQDLSGHVSVLVIGGGSMTTRRTGGSSYDYAVATEFGTVKEAPEPFFYVTYRAYKLGALDQFRETFEDTIEENNKVRGLRSQANSFNSVHYRGGVVFKK